MSRVTEVNGTARRVELLVSDLLCELVFSTDAELDAARARLEAKRDHAGSEKGEQSWQQFINAVTWMQEQYRLGRETT